jgi:manganese-dependent inorganic pyrophosphatase
MQTIVIGHRNPDMDAICSAIAYAEFKGKLGMADVMAARAGNTNERIDFVLGRFGFPAPDFVSDFNTESRRPDGYNGHFCPARLFRLRGD